MINGITIDNNKAIIELSQLKEIAISDIVNELKTILYNNNIDVFYVIAEEYDNELFEFYSIKKFVEILKEKFNIFLMLKTSYFASTKYFDSIFALGVDALTLCIAHADRCNESFEETISYATRLWPSGAIFIDIIAENRSDDEIRDLIGYYSKLKIIPKMTLDENCEESDTTFCLRDFIIKSLKDNGISLRWVTNFELCSVLCQSGDKGRKKRRLAGKFAFELASLRRKLMIKEVQNSFDSASL